MSHYKGLAVAYRYCENALGQRTTGAPHGRPLLKQQDGRVGDPQDFFDKMNAEFGFTLDATATARRKVCALLGEGPARNPALARSWSASSPRESTRDGGTTSFVTPTKLVI